MTEAARLVLQQLHMFGPEGLMKEDWDALSNEDQQEIIVEFRTNPHVAFPYRKDTGTFMDDKRYSDYLKDREAYILEHDRLLHKYDEENI